MSDLISRGVPLDDLKVKGRTVTAYAAVFKTPTEIKDQHGHYIEDLHPTSFNKTVKEAGSRAGYFYNHGLTIHGTPSDAGSVPLGVSRSVTPDSRGLLTVAEISKSPMGDAVLEAIDNGAITGYSFTGKIFRSNPSRIPRATRAGDLPKVTRMEMGLREYGPTPFPAYADAAIMSVRSGLPFNGQGAILSETDRAALLYELLMRFTGFQPNAESITPNGADESEPGESHSDRVRAAIRDRIANSPVRDWNEEAQRNP